MCHSLVTTANNTNKTNTKNEKTKTRKGGGGGGGGREKEKKTAFDLLCVYNTYFIVILLTVEGKLLLFIDNKDYMF